MSVAEIHQTPEGLIAHLNAKQSGESGNSYWGRCPLGRNHKNNDEHPSLELTLANRGWVWLECHSGCEFAEVREALPQNFRHLVKESVGFASPPVAKTTRTKKASTKKRGTPTSAKPTKIADDSKESAPDWSLSKLKKFGLGPIVDTYYYDDVNGDFPFCVTRHEPKDFRPWHKVDGKWEMGKGDVTWPIYRLSEVCAQTAAGGVIHVVEGEKDARAIHSVGGVATTNAGGAKKFLYEYGELFVGASEVIVTADKDGEATKFVGLQHAKQVMLILDDWNVPVRVVEAKEGKDVSDHLKANCGLDELVPVSEEALSKVIVKVPGATVTDITPDAVGDGEETSATVLMVRHLEEEYELGCDHEHTPWAVLKKGSRVALQINDKDGELVRNIRSEFFIQHGWMPSVAAALCACSHAHFLAENSSTPVAGHVK